ncbi:MAG: hypothetical protein ACAH80_16650 [Alphaproteobacteria bacterium]
MKFPSIKDLFKGKSKKADEAAPAAAPEKPAPTIKEWTPPNRTSELAPLKNEAGFYEISLDIQIPNTPVNGQFVHMCKSNDVEFSLALIGPSPLSQAKTVATGIENAFYKQYGLDVGKTYFKRFDAPFYIDGYCEFTGLPPGNGFKMILVPEGSTWEPPAGTVMPALTAQPGSNVVLQHPLAMIEWHHQMQLQYAEEMRRRQQQPGFESSPLPNTQQVGPATTTEAPKEEKAAVATPAAADQPKPPQPKTP